MLSAPVRAVAEQRSGAENMQSQARGLISQFFEDPMRTQEINNQVQSQLDVSLANIGRQAQQAEMQNRFAAARAGNAGGSVQLDRNAAIQGAAGQQVAGATNQAEAQRFGLEQQQQQQQLQELLNTFLRPQAFQQSEQTLLGSIGQQQNQVAGQQQATNNLNTAQQFASDEFSRAIGGTLTNAGNAFQMNNNVNGAMQQQQQLQQLLRALGAGGGQF